MIKGIQHRVNDNQCKCKSLEQRLLILMQNELKRQEK